MFEYFPGNYLWNLGVVAALNSGGLIDEVDRACRPIREAAARGEDVGTARLPARVDGPHRQLAGKRRRPRRPGIARTAGQMNSRAANYLCEAERLLPGVRPGRIEPTGACWAAAENVRSDRPATSRVEMPYEDGTLPGYFTGRSAGPTSGDDHVQRARLDQGAHGRLRLPARAGCRGIWTLMVDCRARGKPCGCRGSRRGSTPRSGPQRASTGWARGATSTRDGSDWSGGRSADITRRAQRPSRSGWRWAWPGGRTMTGVPSSAAAWSGKGNARCRTTGSTCSGSGASTTSTSSSPSPTT